MVSSRFLAAICIAFVGLTNAVALYENQVKRADCEACGDDGLRVSYYLLAEHTNCSYSLSVVLTVSTLVPAWYLHDFPRFGQRLCSEWTGYMLKRGRLEVTRWRLNVR